MKVIFHYHKAFDPFTCYNPNCEDRIKAGDLYTKLTLFGGDIGFQSAKVCLGCRPMFEAVVRDGQSSAWDFEDLLSEALAQDRDAREIAAAEARYEGER